MKQLNFIIYFFLIFLASCNKEEIKTLLHSGKLKRMETINGINISAYNFKYNDSTGLLQAVYNEDDSINPLLTLTYINNTQLRLTYYIERGGYTELMMYNIYIENNVIKKLMRYDTLSGFEFEYDSPYRFVLKDNKLDTSVTPSEFSFLNPDGIKKYDFVFRDSIFLTTYIRNCSFYCEDLFSTDTITFTSVAFSNFIPLQQLHSTGEDFMDPLYILGINGLYAYPQNTYLIDKYNSVKADYTFDNNKVKHMKYLKEYYFEYYP